METFIQQIINGLVLGSMYALVALGYTMVYGIINLINFAHGEVLMVGALTSWTVVSLLAASGLPGWALMLISLLCAIVVCCILNFAIEKVAYRPLRNAPTGLMKALGHGQGYRYAHDEEGGFAAGERYLPDGLPELRFYEPVQRGLEIRIAERLAQLREANERARASSDRQAPGNGSPPGPPGRGP